MSFTAFSSDPETRIESILVRKSGLKEKGAVTGASADTRIGASWLWREALRLGGLDGMERYSGRSLGRIAHSHVGKGSNWLGFWHLGRWSILHEW